jgi:hypothetical protein
VRIATTSTGARARRAAPDQQDARARLDSFDDLQELVMLVRFITTQESVDEIGVRADIGGDMLQCTHILWQAGSSKGSTGPGIIGRNVQLGVRNKYLVHLARGDIEVLAHAADLVGKCHLHRVPTVVDELGQFGLANADMEYRGLDALM